MYSAQRDGMSLITQLEVLSPEEQRNVEKIFSGEDVALYRHLGIDSPVYRYVPLLEHLYVRHPQELTYCVSEVLHHPEWAPRILEFHPIKLTMMEPSFLAAHPQLLHETLRQDPWMLSKLDVQWRTPDAMRAALEGMRSSLDTMDRTGLQFAEQVKLIATSAPESFWDRDSAHLCARLNPHAVSSLPRLYREDDRCGNPVHQVLGLQNPARPEYFGSCGE